AGGEAAAVELHHRAQVRRQHRQDRLDHPLGAVARLAERLDDAQPLGRLLAALARRRARLGAQLVGQLLHVDDLQALAYRLGAHARLEDAAAALHQLAVLALGERLQRLDRLDLRDAGVGLGSNLVDLARQLALDLRLLLGVQVLPRLGAIHDVLLGALVRQSRVRLQPLAVLADAVFQLVEVVWPHHRVFLDDGPVQALHADVVRGRLVLVTLQLGPLLLAAAGQLAHALFGGLLGRADLRVAVGLHLADGPLARLFVYVGDDVLGEVQHLLQRARRHVEQEPDAAGRALHEPDVAHRRSQLDVAHTLAAHLGARHLDAALVAHPLVLAAGALPVLRRPKDALAEQAVALGLERPVVDRLGLGDLAARPRPDLLGRRQRDPNGIEMIDF